MKLQLTSTKQIQIDKAQSSMLTIVATAVAVTVFSLVSTKALLSQAAYQRRVINARHLSNSQIQQSIKQAGTLIDQYNNVFENPNAANALGGKNDASNNSTPPNVDNARLVLDALPTTYDYPALLTSIQKVLTDSGIGSPSIGGSDQSTPTSSASASNPQPLPIELTISGTATYQGVQTLISSLQQSIRPFDITKLTLSGNESSMVVTLNVTTYYQPAKSLLVNSKEIR